MGRKDSDSVPTGKVIKGRGIIDGIYLLDVYEKDSGDCPPIELCSSCKKPLNMYNSGLCNICGSYKIREKLGTLDLEDIIAFNEYLEKRRKEQQNKKNNRA